MLTHGELETSKQYKKLQIKYGINVEDYDKLFTQQEGKCGRSDLMLSVDHDHETGRIRGLLCLPCNGEVAWLERIEAKDSDWMKSALAYLSTEVTIIA